MQAPKQIWHSLCLYTVENQTFPWQVLLDASHLFIFLGKNEMETIVHV